MQTTTTHATYLGARAEVTTIRDGAPLGLRAVVMKWLDAPAHGGWPAGTTTVKVMRGDGRIASGPGAAVIHYERRVPVDADPLPYARALLAEVATR